jgi:hypothetical protein
MFTRSIAAASEIGALYGAEADRCRSAADPLRDAGWCVVNIHLTILLLFTMRLGLCRL